MPGAHVLAGSPRRFFGFSPASQPVHLWMACAVLVSQNAAHAGATTATGSNSVENDASTGVTLAELNANVELLSQKMENLTDQMKALLQPYQLIAKGGTASVLNASNDRKTRDEDSQGDLEELPKDDQHPAAPGTDQKIGGDEARNGGDMGGNRNRGAGGGSFGPAWLVVVTFVHEAWLFLQHANILLNPLCQKLDRSYGVALLKRRLYWVIATVLAAYWAREVLSMCMAAFYVSVFTMKMVLVSTVYHVAKISLIWLDARRGWSPTLGIMRLLMDHWHLSSVKDLLLCIKRVSLQAFDTVTHALIIRDMLRWDGQLPDDRRRGLRGVLIVVAVVWAVHAIANLVTRKSTATLVVEVAKNVVGNWGTPRENHPGRTASERTELREGGYFGGLDGGSADFACSASCSHGHKPCEVCHLLTRDQPPAPPALLSRRKRVD